MCTCATVYVSVHACSTTLNLNFLWAQSLPLTALSSGGLFPPSARLVLGLEVQLGVSVQHFSFQTTHSLSLFSKQRGGFVPLSSTLFGIVFYRPLDHFCSFVYFSFWLTDILSFLILPNLISRRFFHHPDHSVPVLEPLSFSDLFAAPFLYTLWNLFIISLSSIPLDRSTTTSCIFSLIPLIAWCHHSLDFMGSAVYWSQHCSPLLPS